MSKEHTLIFGLGGIGAVYGLFFQRSGKATISTVARSNYEIVKERGMRVESTALGTETLRFEAVYNSADPPKDLDRPFSFIVIATKALTYVKPDLVESIAPYVTDEKSTIVIIQNGVGIEDEIRQRWPRNVILTCVAWVGATQVSPGVVQNQSGITTTVGPFGVATVDGSPSTTLSDVENQRIDAFVGMVEGGGGKVLVVKDHIAMQAERWKKVAWNAAWNALTALTDLDTRTYLSSSPFAEPVAHRLIVEIATVAKRLGINIDEVPKPGEESTLIPLDEFIVERVRPMAITSSMRTDAQNQRSMEVEVILGNPLRDAKKLGIDTPVLETIYALASALDARFAGRIRAVA